MLNKMYDIFNAIGGKDVILKYMEAYNSCLQDPRNTFTCIRGSLDSLCDLLGLKENLFFNDGVHIQDKLFDLADRGFDIKSIEHLRAIKNVCNNAAHLKDLKFVPDSGNAICKLNEYHNLLFSISMKYLGIIDKIEFEKPDSSEKERLYLYKNALENPDAESLYLTAVYIEKLFRAIDKSRTEVVEEIAKRNQHLMHAKYFYGQAALHSDSGYNHKALYRLALVHLKESDSFFEEDEAFTDDNEKSGFNYLEQSAEKGNSDAQNLYAELLVKFPHHYKAGTESYINKILNYFHKSAEQDNFKALHNLMHYHTYGIWNTINTSEHLNCDYTKAFDYGWKAANAGYANAQFKLSMMFRKGLGCNKDLEKADKWFRMALAKKEPQAIVYQFTNNLDKMTNKEKLSYLKILEQDNHILSLYITAKEYYDGIIVKPDYLKSLILLSSVLEYKDSQKVTQCNDDDLTSDHFPIEYVQMAQSENLVKKVVKKWISTISDTQNRAIFKRMFTADGYPLELTISDFPAAIKKAQADYVSGMVKLLDSDLVGQVKEQNIGRNGLCPCGSNIKYKKCHGKRLLIGINPPEV